MNQVGLIKLTGDISSMVTISLKKENGLNSKIVAKWFFILKNQFKNKMIQKFWNSACLSEYGKYW